VKLGSADIGGALGFNFSTAAATSADGGAHWVDTAPDMGWWSYGLTSVKPVIGMPTASPIALVAGERLRMTMPITRSDSGSKVPAGAVMTIEPTINGILVPHTEKLSQGTASLYLTVPSGTAGARLRVSVTVKLGSQSVTKVMTLRIG
jgi:hypothetical protein